MFRLDYRITEFYKKYDPEVVKLGEIFGEYGEFQMYVNDKVYIDFSPLDKDRFEEPIYNRFYYLLEAIILLENSDYVLISDYETINLWIEIKRNVDNLYISIVSIEDEENWAFITTSHMKNVTYKYFKNEQVLYSEFCFEVVNKTERYLLELKELNHHVNTRVSRFENKLLEVKKIVDAKIK